MANTLAYGICISATVRSSFTKLGVIMLNRTETSRLV